MEKSTTTEVFSSVNKNKNNEKHSLSETLDELNKDQLFIIEQRGSRFYLKHKSVNEPLPLKIRTIEQAVTLRSFLEKKDVKNQGCLQRAELNNCILREMGDQAGNWKLQNKHDVYRTEDLKKGINFFSNPFLYQEELPSFLKGETAPANTVEIIMKYMNNIMIHSSFNGLEKFYT
ncbi:hypothetical protein GW819_00220 [Candidatus Gracilibacteria bacterium]|nr:hypothetical protein [Candidatus Gracilibacteria bacterium]OIO77811.1 MAG: hypothetical protein AUJ87_00780 [Candidatus Gracilibacteria bacterium CG1_02_38_174]PIQ12019.1 MAG: hypothetical protein COW68_01125 [Candidatus Gracilibacteria bacterium CG18_big_fil_WC_8_21_14_2_50_38_16]PIQ41902.1 MAG: hypothetical protein COW06_01490 [Candidatus Gracilibacteria bacterium CG12_big_fil_rev_8_21_14_0_65_38_15]